MKKDNIIKTVVNGKEVQISFSNTESVGLKECVRDILISSFEERFLNSVKDIEE